MRMIIKVVALLALFCQITMLNIQLRKQAIAPEKKDEEKKEEIKVEEPKVEDKKEEIKKDEEKKEEIKKEEIKKEEIKKDEEKKPVASYRRDDKYDDLDDKYDDLDDKYDDLDDDDDDDDRIDDLDDYLDDKYDNDNKKKNMNKPKEDLTKLNTFDEDKFKTEIDAIKKKVNEGSAGTTVTPTPLNTARVETIVPSEEHNADNHTNCTSPIENTVNTTTI